MKHISVLIKPASSLCNLRCKYCFYANISSLREVRSYGKMRPHITEKMIDNIYKDLNNGDSLTLGFQGGEPTVAGLHYYKHLVEIVNQQEKDINVNYSIQTNGTLIDEAWCTFLKENHFLVDLSIDGHEQSHDLNRLDHKGENTFDRVLHTKKMFDQYEIEYNILCVLTEQLSQEANLVFDFIMENDIDYIQFVPCMDDLDATERSDFALTPHGFANFYHDIFDLWLNELKSGHYISIKLFDDIVNLFVNRQIIACGMVGNCSIQYVIEGDGTVFPCDFYALDEYKLGNITTHTLREIFNQDISFKFLEHKRELPSLCSSCPFKRMCKDGCMRMKDAMYVTESNDFCGYQNLLKEFIPRINDVLEYTSLIPR